MRPIWRWLTLLCILACLLGCGSEEPARDAGNASSDADASVVLSVCNPIAPECGDQEWQFESHPSCPQSPPAPLEDCPTAHVTCYFCEEPEAAASESGHAFKIMACAPESRQWQVQELVCATQ